MSFIDQVQSLIDVSDAMPEQRTDAWHAFRSSNVKVTGSEIGTILGHNPFQTRETVLLRKCGYDPDPFTGNEATRHGTYYEPIAVRYYERQYDQKITEMNIIPFKKTESEDFFKKFAYSPDGVIIMDDDIALVEIKCPLRRSIYGDIPEQYMDQMQFGMFVLQSYVPSLRRCEFIQFRPSVINFNGEDEMTVQTVEFDPKWVDTNVPLLLEFIKEVEEWRERGIETHPAVKSRVEMTHMRLADFV